MCDLVTNNSKHLRSSRGAFNDPRSFYSTIYSTSYNKDFSPNEDTANYKRQTGFVSNVKPFVSLTPDWKSKPTNYSKFNSDQFETITDRDYKSFKFPSGHEITPQYFLKGDTSRYGKERLITTPAADQVCSEADRCSEQTDAFRDRRANPYTHRDLFLSNIVPNKQPGKLGVQVYELCDPKMKLQPWGNLPVTSEDYVNPNLYKNSKHAPVVSTKAERTTGVTLTKPFTGEDWYPFDRNVEKSAGHASNTESLGSVARLNEGSVKRDPCRIINSRHPRLMSIQGADYARPDLDFGRTPRTMLEYNKTCMPSAYARVGKSEVLPFTSRVCASTFATETSREFGNRSLASSGNKGFDGNFSRVGLKNPRIMRHEQIPI